MSTSIMLFMIVSFIVRICCFRLSLRISFLPFPSASFDCILIPLRVNLHFAVMYELTAFARVLSGLEGGNRFNFERCIDEGFCRIGGSREGCAQGSRSFAFSNINCLNVLKCGLKSYVFSMHYFFSL